MSKVKNADLSGCKPIHLSVVKVDDHLLALLNQLKAMGLADSLEVLIDGPIDHAYTSTKLMQRLTKRITAPWNLETTR
jgi:hypothetical protein